MMRYFFCILTVFTHQAWGAPNDYNGIFTTDIYDQSSIKQKLDSPNYSDEEKTEEARTHLRQRKIAAIKGYIEKNLECRIKLCEEVREEEKSKLRNVGFMESGFTLAKIILLVWKGQEASDLLNKFNRAPFNVQKAVSPESFPEGSLARLMQQMMELRMQAEALMKGVESEIIQEEEWAYIDRKRFLPESLQITIEESLISIRKGFFSHLNRVEYIRDALTVPYQPKPLTTHETDEFYQDLKQKFYSDPFFSRLSSRIKKQLWSAVSLMYYSSHSRDSDTKLYRQSYYFWGKPGVGKSAAARRIATFTGLPFSEPPSITHEDFTKEQVEGTRWMHHAATRGWFIDCLCQRAPDGKTYINGIMIINDFDRLFLAKGPKAEAALAFLMHFLDPENRIIYSPYFKTEIDISRLVIITTANNPIPKEEKFAALRSRLGEDNIIEFPDIEPELAVLLLRTEFQNYCNTFHIPTELSANEDVENAIILHVIATSPQPSMRDYNNILYQIVHKVKCGDVKGKLLKDILSAGYQLYIEQLKLPDDLTDSIDFEEAVINLVISESNQSSILTDLRSLREVLEAAQGNLDIIRQKYLVRSEPDSKHTTVQTDVEVSQNTKDEEEDISIIERFLFSLFGSEIPPV